MRLIHFSQPVTFVGSLNVFIYDIFKDQFNYLLALICAICRRAAILPFICQGFSRLPFLPYTAGLLRRLIPTERGNARLVLRLVTVFITVLRRLVLLRNKPVNSFGNKSITIANNAITDKNILAFIQVIILFTKSMIIFF
jgi:hypothetical protein